MLKRPRLLENLALKIIFLCLLLTTTNGQNRAFPQACQWLSCGNTRLFKAGLLPWRSHPLTGGSSTYLPSSGRSGYCPCDIQAVAPLRDYINTCIHHFSFNSHFTIFVLFTYLLILLSMPPPLVSTFIAQIYSSLLSHSLVNPSLRPILRPHSSRALAVPQARAVLLPSLCTQPQTQRDTNSSGWSIPPHLKNQLTTTAFLKNCKDVLGQVLKIEFSYGKLMLTKG